MTLPPPLVGVVIPCFKKEATVGRAINSVKQQTLSNFVCVVVIDGSPDNSEVIARINTKDDLRFRVIVQENRGVAHARNRGIAEIDAPFISALDADDEMEPTFLETCVKALIDDASVGMAYTKLRAVNPDGSSTISAWPGEFNADRFVAGGNQVSTLCVFRRDIWQRLGGYRQRYAPHGQGAEDGEFWYRIMASGYKGKLATTEPLFRYYLGGAVSGNPNYREVNWRQFHPETQDGIHPFASVATPSNGLSHPVRPYDNPRISVIVPVGEYHRNVLVDALDSIEGQTFRDWELIVVADGFSWDSATHDAYPYAHFIEMTKRGAGAARNEGAKVAKSPYLLFLDADDWLTTDALITFHQAAKAHPGHIIYGDYTGHAFLEPRERERLRASSRLLDYDEKTNESIIQYSAMEYDCEKAMLQPQLQADGSFYIWNLVTSLVPKLYHDEIGGFDESMPSWEDWDYWLRLAWAGKCFVRVPRTLVEYRFYTGQRRALANPNESGDLGRQTSTKLIQYLQDKRRRTTIMPCGGCKKHASSYASPAPSLTVMQQAPMQRTTTMANVTSSDMVMVELSDGNLGDHPIAFGGTFYGYRSHGDRFQMLRQHAVSYRGVRILSETELFPPDDVPVAPKSQLAAPVVIAKETPVVVENFQLPTTMMSGEKADKEEKTITLQPEVFDFTQIWGINEERAQMLHDMGVRTLSGFFSLEDERLAEMFNLKPIHVKRMMNSAKELAG